MSRPLSGVVTFDIGRDLVDPDTLIGVEVFESREDLDRQESLPETAKARAPLEDSLVTPPDATIYNVASSEPWG